MKYSAINYAHAFAQLAVKAEGETAEKKLVKEFWATVEKNGDLAKKSKIITEAERLLRLAHGLNLWEVETARPTRNSAKDILKGIAKSHDVIVQTVNPELVAGVRITKNGEEQLDASLANRLNKLFVGNSK